MYRLSGIGYDVAVDAGIAHDTLQGRAFGAVAGYNCADHDLLLQLSRFGTEGCDTSIYRNAFPARGRSADAVQEPETLVTNTWLVPTYLFIFDYFFTVTLACCFSLTVLALFTTPKTTIRAGRSWATTIKAQKPRNVHTRMPLWSVRPAVEAAKLVPLRSSTVVNAVMMCL